MGGATLVRELTPRRAVRAPFAVATPADGGEIRRVLRENPMSGRITLTLEREPDYFADADLPRTEKQTVIAKENNRVVCVGSCAIRERLINGESRRIGYLGELRLDARAAGRFDILRRGYEFFRELQTDAPADYYFTSIAADNARARKFLERGLSGMPAYQFVGEFVTTLVPAGTHSRNSGAPPVGNPESGELLASLNKHGRQYQFAECWSAQELAALPALGLHPENFHSIRSGGRISAVAALWDQRVFKQTVVRGYGPWLALVRPGINIAAQILGTPRLPAVGSTLAHAFVSHLAVDPAESNAFLGLIARLRTVAAGRGIEFLTVGLAANDSRLASLRRSFRCREYRSRIYVVRWPGLGGSAQELDGRSLGPEVALL